MGRDDDDDKDEDEQDDLIQQRVLEFFAHSLIDLV